VLRSVHWYIHPQACIFAVPPRPRSEAVFLDGLTGARASLTVSASPSPLLDAEGGGWNPSVHSTVAFDGQMPSRQERRRAEREAAKRAPDQAGVARAAGAAAPPTNVTVNPLGDWTTQSEDPAAFGALGAENVKRMADEGDAAAQYSQGYRLLCEAGAAGMPLGMTRSTKADVGFALCTAQFPVAHQTEVEVSMWSFVCLNKRVMCGCQPWAEEGTALLEKAAGQGQVYAMEELGGIHYTRTEHALAVTWHTKGAEAGLPKAMYNLGVMLDAGEGVAAPDYPAAADWYRRAAVAGEHVEAAINLSTMYQVGRGRARQNMSASSILDPRCLG